MVNYYTVTQYARLLGKDTGNIRKLLLKGEIKGEKIGKQWIIPKDTIYPVDKRIKTGEYRNWRKKLKISSELMKKLKMLSMDLGTIYGSCLEKVVLYGSYARGEQTEDSDVDIAIFLKNGSTEDMHELRIDVTVEYELDCGVTLSVVPIECDEYAKWSNTLPFYKNVDKEGIVIWKAV